MADMTRFLVSELEQEAATTRRVMERVPADRLDFQPHPKAMSLGQLALHVARIPGAMSRMARLDAFDAANAKFNPEAPELDEARGDAPWQLRHGEKELLTMPRFNMIRSLMLNHWYHHRGQLVTYLRTLDVAVPSVYGPTADENPFAAAIAA
jgi:uncharacterized damage-inducible protein DinB